MAGQVSEVEETLKRLGTHPGFNGYLIVDGHGLPIRSSLDHALAVQYSGLITTLGLNPLQLNSNSYSITLLLRLSPVLQRVTVPTTAFVCSEKDPLGHNGS